MYLAKTSEGSKTVVPDIGGLEWDHVARGSRVVRGIRAGSCERSVHVNAVPTRLSSASWKVRDEEEFAGAGSEG